MSFLPTALVSLEQRCRESSLSTRADPHRLGCKDDSDAHTRPADRPGTDRRIHSPRLLDGDHQQRRARDKCNILTGITLSSEALAVAPKLDEWNAIFLSSDNGDGKLTAGALVPNFFRANISAPMGARAVSLFLRHSKWQKFYAIGMDYAWGHSSVGVFESEIKHAKEDLVGTVFSPIGTKDFSTYITKIRQSGAEALYIVMAGDDFNAFLAQAAQYKLPEKVQMLTEQMELTLLRAVGDAALGLVGSTRYAFTIDNPKNKEFVALWQKEHGTVPDT